MGEERTALQGLNTLEDEGRTGEGGTSSKTVEVRGFSMDTSHDLLEMYFENSRRSGGGDIEEFEIKDDVAYVTFEEPEVVQRVVSKSPHQVAGQTLTVRQFCPPLQKPCYENRVLVQSAVNEELLTNFLEKETGMNVMEFLYGEEGRQVVVTFANHIDFATLRKACYTTKIEGFFLRVAKVVISSCIFVKNLPPVASHDVILLYFENRRRSGGGEVERVEMNTAERYCLVYFVDHDVIDRVLSQQHKIDGADIEVHLHHECLGERSSRSRYDPFLQIYKPEMKENPLKAETSSSVSSCPDRGSNYVETTKWQEDDGKNCVLPLWIKYKRASERMIIKIIKELPCSWNFHVFWNFFTKTKQGQQMLDDILKKYGCSVTVPGDNDDLFIFEIFHENFEEESEMMDCITGALDAVFACAQQSLFFDIFLVDHRMLEDVLQTIKQTKEMDSAWIELVGEQEPDAVCVVCTEKEKASILKVVTTIKNAIQDRFENYWNVVLIDPMWHKVLKKFGYLQEMSEKFPNLTMTPDEAKSNIMLKGPRDQSSAAAKHLMELLATAHAEVQEDIFFPGCQFDIFAYPEMCDYIDNSVIKLPFVWIPNHQTKKMHLFSKKLEQEKDMDKFIKAFIKEKIYPLTKDQSLCNPTIARSLEELMKKHKGKIVINYSPTGLILTSADDIFESVDAVVQEIIGIKTDHVEMACVTKTHPKRHGQLVDQSEYKTSENQRKTEDSLPAKRDDTSEQKTKYPEDIKSVPNVNFDQLEVMIQPEIKVKISSDGIGIIKPENKVKPNSDGIGKIKDTKKSTCTQPAVGLVPVGGENMVSKSLTDPSQVSKDGTTAIVAEGTFEKILPIENRSVYRSMIKVARWIKKTGLEHTVEVRELNEPLRVGFVLQGPSDRVLEMTDYIKKVQEGIITQKYLTFSTSEVSYLGSAEGQQIIARLEEENSCSIQIIDPAKVTGVDEKDHLSGGSIGSYRMVTFVYPHNQTVSLLNGMVENCKTDVIVMLVLTPSTPRGQRKSQFIVAQSRTRLYVPLSNERNSDAEMLLFEDICATLHYLEDKNYVKVGFAINPVGNWRMEKFVKVFLCAVNDFFSQSQETSGWKVYLCTTDEDEFERMKGSAIDFLQPLITAQNKAEDAYMVKIDAALSKAVLPSNPVHHFDRIELRVEAGDLSQFEADVIVNTTSLNLDLNNGETSKSLFRAAGQKIQDECKKAYPKGIHEGEVARTSGGKMKCKEIFHGALKRYSNSDMDWSNKLKMFIDVCLTLASQSEYKSIAFPALGTGILGLPRDHVAHVMFNCVKEFSYRKFISVEKVFFVIYHKDEVTLQVFQDAIKKFKVPEKGNIESSCLEIQVTGMKDRVYEVITSIQKEFKIIDQLALMNGAGVIKITSKEKIGGPTNAHLLFWMQHQDNSQ